MTLALVALIAAGIAIAVLGLLGAPAGARHPGAVGAGCLGVVVVILSVMALAQGA